MRLQDAVGAYPPAILPQQSPHRLGQISAKGDQLATLPDSLRVVSTLRGTSQASNLAKKRI